MKGIKKSIKRKIIIFAILATFLPSLGLGLWSFQLSEELVGDNLTRELHALANFTSRELDLWVNEHIHASRALSTSDIVIDRLTELSQFQANKSEILQQDLSNYLSSVSDRLGTTLQLAVVDVEERLVASSARTPAVTKFPKDWPQSVHMGGKVVTPPNWNAQYSTATLSIAIPVLSNDNFVIGTLVAMLDLSTLQPNLKGTTELSLGNVVLLDAEGKLLLSSYPELAQPVSMDSLIFKQLQDQPGEASDFVGILQRKVIGLAYMSDTLPVTVIAERDYQEVYAARSKLGKLFLGFVGILIIPVTFIALGVGRSIVMPLQRLIDATKRIVEGDLEVKLAVEQNDELGQLTQTFNQMTDKLRRNQAEITANNQAMEKKNLQLEELSITDGLTGLYNRSKLNTVICEQLALFKRHNRPFSVLMLDVDHFKTLNDQLGHIAGDEVLIAVARILDQSIRSVDFAARYGGDEFIVIQTETTAGEAQKTAERIRSQVVDIYYGSNGKSITVKLSIGIVQCKSEDATPTILLSRVDNALYAAKRAGRDQAVVKV